MDVMNDGWLTNAVQMVAGPVAWVAWAQQKHEMHKPSSTRPFRNSPAVAVVAMVVAANADDRATDPKCKSRLRQVYEALGRVGAGRGRGGAGIARKHARTRARAHTRLLLCSFWGELPDVNP